MFGRDMIPGSGPNRVQSEHISMVRDGYQAAFAEVRLRRRGKCWHFPTRRRSAKLRYLARDTLALPGLKAPWSH